MPTIRVAIVAPPSDSLNRLLNELERKAGQKVKTFISMADVQARFIEKDHDLILVHVARFSIEKVEWVLRVRARFPRHALIIVAGEIDPNARFQLRQIARFKLLDEQFELKDVASIALSLTGNDPAAAARQHARTDREGWAELSDVTGAFKLKARFLDFAQMGAKVLVPSDAVQAKTKWILRYPSSAEPGKIQSLFCYVVWESLIPSAQGSHHGPQQVVGLRFIAAG